MANAVATVSITDNRYQSSFGNQYRVLFSVTINNANYVTGGIAMNFFNAEVKASRTPMAVRVWGISGFDYSYVLGADASTGLLKIFQGGTEATGGSAIPAGVLADTIQGEAIFFGME